ncbi:MAG: HEPN domain-containing protein [Deltaproteobacteria bacterium]|nr:HEPN domain-containing protein [Deltaproteobacteria bacterium]
MFYRVRVVYILCLLFLPSSVLYAQDKEPPPSGGEIAAISEELNHRLDTNRHFIMAARAIVGDSDHQEAKRFLKMAESTTAEAVNHYEAGLYDSAMEDLSESTQMAIHAIILVKGEAPSTRKFIIQEEFARQRREERDKTVVLINRRTIETRTFIRAAERMLEKEENRKARTLLENAKDSLGLALVDLEQGLHDEALTTVNEAYTLATGSVKEISRSRGGVISFPKPSSDSQEELFSYELKQNGTHLYFASGVVKDGKGDIGRALKDGRAMRRKAIRLMEDGKAKEAIEMLKSSTELLAEAINMAVQPNPCAPLNSD